MRVVYSPSYHLDFGAHVFPTDKYRRVAARVAAAGLVPDGFVAPTPASWEALALVHTAAYLDAAAHGTLSPEAIARLEIPCTPAIVDGFRLMTGGTIAATRLALDGRDRVAVHIGGGFHHAFAGHGEGFCLFNDVAVGARDAFAARLAHRAAVVDLDVHQGNGTASIFAGDASVFTFSMHGARNFPLRKERSDLDVELPDGLEDAGYLARLEEHLPACFERSRPDLVVYLAGVDVAAGDRFGRLALTKSGIGARDRFVLDASRARGVPVCAVLAGGYAKTAEITADLHAEVHRAARDAHG